jgi:RNA polymerase sigma-70 factor, ECF subfamily
VEGPADQEKILSDTFSGRAETPEALVERVYQELRHLARAYMRRERADHTLQATALVNEAYLRLFQGKPFQWENRQHLFCTLARSMRRVLVDHARSHGAERHGGDIQKIGLDGHDVAIYNNPTQLLAINELLDRLARLSPRQAQVVELHSLIGLTEEEVAEVLDVSVKTVKNDWRFAKAWLKMQMTQGNANAAAGT